jgi:hypothetical protein
MLLPAEEETVPVTELRDGDKITDDGEDLLVVGSVVTRDGEVIVPLAVAHGGTPTPYAFIPGTYVTRVLVDAEVSERLPGRHVLPGSA